MTTLAELFDAAEAKWTAIAAGDRVDNGARDCSFCQDAGCTVLCVLFSTNEECPLIPVCEDEYHEWFVRECCVCPSDSAPQCPACRGKALALLEAIQRVRKEHGC